MDSLPQELFDAVPEHLAVYDFPVSARFPVLSDDSRRAILNARLVRRCFRNSRALINLFVSVLEETPFQWHGNQIPRLLEVSRSLYAGRMATLSLCSTNLKPWHQDWILVGDQGMHSEQPVTALMVKDLTTVLKRFVCVKHLRYYPISPKCFREAWPGGRYEFDDGPRAQYGYPQDDERIHTWLHRQQNPSWIFKNTMVNIEKAELILDSVSLPLFGNRASYCGVRVTGEYFPSSLKRLSISISDGSSDVAIFGQWLTALKNLTFFEVATSRDPQSLGPWNPFASCRSLTYTDMLTVRDQLPRLEEFRLMSDNQNCFSEHDLILGLEMFPNLQKLGLAHILIKSQNNNAASWTSFVKRLVPKALERLWLLDPRNLWTDGHMGQAGHYVMSKYWGDDSFRAAAHEVRLVDTESLWVPDKAPPKRRDFDYPGFAIFEQV